MRLLSWFVVVGVLGVLFWRLWLDRAALRSVDWLAQPWLWALHLTLLVLVFVVLAFSWFRCLRIFGDAPGLAASAATWLSSNLGKYVPGKIFMFAGRIEIGRRLGVRPVASVSALAVEHATLLAATAPFLLVALLRGASFGDDLRIGLAAAALLPLLLGALRPSLLVAGVNLLLRAADQPELIVEPKARDVASLLAVYFLGWLSYGGAGIVLLAALGLAGAVSVIDGMAFFVTAWLIGFLSLITPGGLGVREGVLVLLLGPTIGTAEAVTAALVSRLTWSIVELSGAVVGVFLLQSRDEATGP